jgi:hypothetical protein
MYYTHPCMFAGGGRWVFYDPIKGEGFIKKKYNFFLISLPLLIGRSYF